MGCHKLLKCNLTLLIFLQTFYHSAARQHMEYHPDATQSMLVDCLHKHRGGLEVVIL